ncbi:serine hydrolase domain-containing protein [Pseudidiomarina sediminum]|uniref:serine hydrolase domain-containing protein n=1 Tax=Pseudidiomarina sediminum TaxID=431675 RepID=UPI001C93BE46|nr:serine hydrolase [Pseudidiomarina sediminum]MBY6064687.1 beta-lactamase family protein [Pseudidiomarina sediminum]
MKKRTYGMLSGAALLLSTSVQADGVDDAALARLQAQVPDKVAALYHDYQLKGDILLAVIDQRGLRYSFTYNALGSNAAVNGLTPTTPFLVASHTKAFTGTLAQILAVEGEFDLEAPIADYLADYLRNDKVDPQAIKVTQLLNHTAGFTSVMHTFKSAFFGYADDAELIDALNEDIRVAPAQVFRYSNTGPILAAQAMASATGKHWKVLLQEKLFRPLAMQNTSAKLSDYPAGTILPSIEVGKDGQILRIGLFKTDQTLHASGGVVSTLEDLSSWLAFNLRQGAELATDSGFFTPLHQATTTQDKTYFTYDRTGYSLAWDIAEYHGEPILTRFGGYAGNSFHASFLPEQSVAVIAFFNGQRGYLLPHLLANFAYNLVITPTLAQPRFTEEMPLFAKSFAREQQHALDRARRVTVSQTWSQRLGHYRNHDGWPDLYLYNYDNQVWAQSGALSGPLYHEVGKTDSFVANFGSLRRPLTFTTAPSGAIRLLNGSLEYHKQENVKD